MRPAARPGLTPEQFAAAKALFQTLVDRPTVHQRAALADDGVDPAVRDEVRRLLDHTASGLDAAPAFAVLSRLADGPASGASLGAWKLTDEIGAGGMGKVFRAERNDDHFQQQAAVKLLGGLPSPAALRHLARERQILASLTHPNIARLLDGGSTDTGQPYLVMEYVEGLPILDYCEQRALPTPTRLALLLDVCAAVAYAHAQLVVHCDLRPGNILVNAAGRPMLLDFGISRLLTDTARARDDDAPMPATDPRVTSIAYTPRYASPEQKAGLRVGTATDIYSLGLLLAELLDAPWPDDAAPDLTTLSDEPAAIVARATHADPAQRYPTVDHLAADLRRFLAGDVVQARQATPTYLARKWLKRHWAGTAVAAVFVATVGGFSWQMRQERDAALAAEQAARAVRDYMVSVFQGADPELAGKRDRPVSQFLDAGSAQLKDSLRDQPRTRAEMAGILGGVYHSIGQRQQALGLFDQSIELARAERMPGLLADSLYRKAYTLYDMEALTDALPVAREALAEQERIAPGSSSHVASLRLLGSVLGYKGDTTEAPQRLGQALTLATTGFGADSVEAGMAHLDLARYQGVAGEPGAVLEHAMRAGEIFTARLGADHIRVADALEMRILGLAQLGRAADAVPLAQTLVERRTALYGEWSHQRSYALHAQGSVPRRTGRLREAMPVFEASLAIHDRLDGRDSVARLEPMFGLARTFEEAGAHAQALEQFEGLLAIQLAQAAAGFVTPARLRVHIGRNLRLLDRPADARALLESLVAELRAEADPDSALIAEAQLERAAGLRALGESAAAQTALDAIDAVTPELRIGLLAERGRLALARQDNDQALAESVQVHGEDALATALLRIDRAAWLRRVGRAAEARALADTLATRLGPAIAPEGRYAVILRDLRS